MSKAAAQLKRNGTSIHQRTHTHRRNSVHTNGHRQKLLREPQRSDNDLFSVGVHKHLSSAQPSTTQHRKQKKIQQKKDRKG